MLELEVSKKTSMNKVAILGTGSWATALANVLLANNNQVALWGIDKSEIQDLKNKKNTHYFGNKLLVKKPNLVTDKVLDIVKFKPKYLIIAIPSIHIESVLNKFIDLLTIKPIIINVAKGFNEKTKTTWSSTINKIITNKSIGLVDLIGPSFAIEVFCRKPTIVNTVSENIELAKKVAKLFNNNFFKCVPINDIIGAETISALKNVMAIASGILYSQHASINTRSAILAQMAKEISYIVEKLGGKLNTLYQFCGIGDIFLTCTDNKSRNFSLGTMIASKGMKAMKTELSNRTYEGFWATKTAYEIINKYKLNAPIITNLYLILFKNADEKKFLIKIFDSLKF